MTGELTQERLKELLSYDPDTGVFTRLSVPTKQKHWLGQKAGNVNALGYERASVDGKVYRMHRLAFLYMTGSWPAGEVDHINGNKADNRWSNLRSVSTRQNLINRLIKGKSSPYPGVSFHKKSGRWYAHVTQDSVNRHVGSFSSEREAYTAYLMEIAESHGEEVANILHNRVIAEVINQH